MESIIMMALQKLQQSENVNSLFKEQKGYFEISKTTNTNK